MSEALEAAVANLEQRIAEIDRLLSETEPLREEREHLVRALEEVSAVVGQPRLAAAAKTTRKSAGRRTRTRRVNEGKRQRAPRGANRDRIVGYLESNGPAPASKIARETSINRAVVYNTLGRMTEEGAAVKQDEDGTTLFALSK